MKLYIKKVKRGKLKDQFYWELRGDNGEFVSGSRPETFHNRADAHHNIDLTSQLKLTELVDETVEMPVPI